MRQETFQIKLLLKNMPCLACHTISEDVHEDILYFISVIAQCICAIVHIYTCV